MSCRAGWCARYPEFAALIEAGEDEDMSSLLRPLLDGLLPVADLSDPGIALLGGLALFTIPAGLKQRRFLHDWDAAKTLP